MRKKREMKEKKRREMWRKKMHRKEVKMCTELKICFDFMKIIFSTF